MPDTATTLRELAEAMLHKHSFGPADFRYLNRLAEGYIALDDWASRMPDAGFNDQDPRWEWWHARPR